MAFNIADSNQLGVSPSSARHEREPEPPRETHWLPLGGRSRFVRDRRFCRSKLAFSRDAPAFGVGRIGLERRDPNHVEHDGKNGVHDQVPFFGSVATIRADRRNRAVTSPFARIVGAVNNP
jgi:hypothetical protein